MSKTDEVLKEVRAEVVRACAKFPLWPDDPIHAVAILGEEFGELQKAVLQSVYEPHKSNMQEARAEAVQAAAMAVSFITSIDKYELYRSPQHNRSALDQ